MQKLLGLDVGTVRIGVAAADNVVKIAHPIATVDAGEDDIATIQALMNQQKAVAIVVGLPRNSKGEETAQSQYSREFATRLEAENIKVHLQDESLTSVTAEQRLIERKRPYSKADIDAEAATIILQDFLDSGRTI
jgi:putative Holliday junction resolvase